MRVVALGLLTVVALPLAPPAQAADVIYQQPYEAPRYSQPAPIYPPRPVYAPRVYGPRYVVPYYVPERYVEVSPGYVLPRYPRREGYVYPPNVLRYDPYGRRYVEIEQMPLRPAPMNPPRGAWSTYPPELDEIEQVPLPYGWSPGR